MSGSSEGNEPPVRMQMQGSVAFVEMMLPLGLGQQAGDGERMECRAHQHRSMEKNMQREG